MSPNSKATVRVTSEFEIGSAAPSTHAPLTPCRSFGRPLGRQSFPDCSGVVELVAQLVVELLAQLVVELLSQLVVELLPSS